MQKCPHENSVSTSNHASKYRGNFMAVELAKLVFQYWSRKKNLLSSLAVEKVIKIIELFLKGTSVVVEIIHFSTWVISVTRWLIHLFKTYMIFALVSAIKPFIQYLAIYHNTNLSQMKFFGQSRFKIVPITKLPQTNLVPLHLMWNNSVCFDRNQCDQIWQFIGLWATF